MSELDTKQKVLVAFYTEYQKDIPNMRRVIASEIGISQDQFTIAIQKLENEGLLTGAKYAKGGRGAVPLMAFTDYIMVTNYGLRYVEDKLGIQPTMSAGEKVKEVSKKLQHGDTTN
ncbi:YjcQ family protein [Peribacillus sp. NPDC094092]|uniref:YjcQ family protein n=1 Tax=Peribacillus sp. NPDC094092 TaxID=3390611 RepID=UPI003D040211